MSILENPNLSKIIKRLELIKTLITLEEEDEIAAHLLKLQQQNLPDELARIIALLNEKLYSQVIVEIKVFIDIHNQITFYNNPEIGAIKLEIKLLENKLIELENEKTVAEKAVFEYDRLFNEIVGETVLRYLLLKRKIKEKETTKKPKNATAEQEYKEAEADYRNFEESYEETKQQAKDFTELTNPEDLITLKKIYREASILCLPDKYLNDLHKQNIAENLFKELNDAYQKQNIEKVTSILQNLMSGLWDSVEANTKTDDLQLLKHILEQLRKNYNHLSATINAIKIAEPYQLVKTENSLADYFAILKNNIEKQIFELQKMEDAMRHDNNPVKVYYGIIKATNTKHTIVRKIIQELSINEKRRLLEFLIANIDNENFSLKILSTYYPITGSLIEKHQNKWDWEKLSQNQFLPWSINLIEKFSTNWDWLYLSYNIALPWTIELVEKFAANLNWWNLSRNGGLPWSIALIEKFCTNWDWETLSKNIFLPWSIELIEKFREKWDWETLSNNKSVKWSPKLIEKFRNSLSWGRYGGLSDNYKGPWSVELIDKYKDNWDWQVLSRNKSFPWSLDLIEKYKDKWDWKYLSEGYLYEFPSSIEQIEKYKDKWDWHSLSNNTSVDWSFELIEKYADKWNWHFDGCYYGLTGNPKLPWSLELIENYEDRWDWGGGNFTGLSSNSNLPWSIELIEKYEDKWNWKGLSDNSGLPWSTELIEKYKDKWDWVSLSINVKLPWSIPLIKRYCDLWDWPSAKYYNDLDSGFGSMQFENGLSANMSLPWDLELLEQYKDKWHWKFLIYSPKVAWSIELFLKYNDKLKGHGNALAHESIYKKIILPLIDDHIVEKVMNKINRYEKS